MLAYFQNLIVFICINSILSMTLNFLMGYTGVFSLAHAVFFGIGAYASAYVSIHLSNSIIVCTLVAMAISAALSIALALPALRVRGEYFVVASLGLQMLAVTVFSEWTSVTGGLGGLTDIPSLSLFGFAFQDSNAFLGLAIAFFMIVTVALTCLQRTSFGRNLQAIRDSESAAAALGKNVPVIKTLAVVLSSSLASMAGVVYTSYLGFVNVEGFTMDTSVLLMAMVVIGGTGTVLGPIVGAILLMFLPAVLSFIPGLQQDKIGLIQQGIYGLVMVLLMIFRPGGLVGGLRIRRSAVGGAR